jgi:hypothetical protein
MTIAAGFRCQNGIALCSDSQYTTWYGKHHGAKIIQAFAKNGTILAAFAGLTDHIGMVKEKIEKATEGLEVSLHSVESLVCSFLDSLSPRENEMFQMLTAFHLREGNSFHLYVSNRMVDTPSTFCPIRRCEIIGCGSSPLTDYLVGLFERFPAFSIEQIGLLGMYLVRQAEKYGEGAGGEAQICALNERGIAVAPYRGLVEEKERLLKEGEGDIALLLFNLIDDRISEDDFDSTLQTLCSRMKNFRRKLRESPIF